MASAVLVESKIRLVFDKGTDGEGKPVTGGKTINNVKKDATPENLIAAAQAIASLQIHPLVDVERNDKQLLSN
ncbi:DUF1659 domain-containing protein [Bacillus gobiensis]|uniref:DUF1659 domain-containing protein n=1 Tax=Bacillus gobiensis TaxID=1441095 RepID=UPI003D19256B